MFLSIFKRSTNNTDTLKDEVETKKLLKKERNRLRFAEDYLNTNDRPFFVHTAVFYKNGNSGDTFIREMTKEVFKELHQDIIEKNCRETFGPLEQKIINRSSAVVIGAGGLLWKRSETKSGWQWNVSDKFLKQLEVPAILFSVGLITFKDGVQVPRKMRESLQILFDKKDTFVLPRNKASYDGIIKNIGKPKGYFAVQPCPSTIVRFYTKVARKNSKVIGFNIPMDKIEDRYKNNTTDVFIAVAEAMKQLSSNGYICKVYSHIPMDNDYHAWLKDTGYSFELVDLSSMNFQQITETYENTAAVFGGRGHSVMIPFGIGIPTVGFHANPKVGYFHSEAKNIFPLVEVEKITESAIVESLEAVLNDSSWDKKNEKLCAEFMKQTEKNIAAIKESIS